MKKLFLLLVFLGSGLTAFSQAPGWAWAKGSGGLLKQEAYDVSTDPWGNVFISGEFPGSISFDTVVHTIVGMGVFLNKYDAAGNLLWSFATGSNGQNACYQVSTDPWGNAYICGRFSGTINFGPFTLSNTTGSLYHFYLVKFDGAGNVLWAESRSGSSTGSDVAWAVHADTAGGVYLSGTFQSDTLVFGTDSLFSNNTGSNFFIAKYDSSGNALWARRSFGKYFEMGKSIVTDASQNIYVTGWFMSDTLVFDADTLFNHKVNKEDIFFVKYDLTGNLQWAKGFGGNNSDIGYNLAIDGQSNVYITGNFLGDTIVFNQDTLYGPIDTCYNYFLAKCDPAGNTIWLKSGSGNASGYTVTVDSAYNVYFSGSFKDSIVLIDTLSLVRPVDYYDPAFITRLDPAGHIRWGIAMGSGGDDQIGIAIGLNGDVFVGGDYAGLPTFILGDDSMQLSGTENIFIAKLEPDTATIIVQAPVASLYSSDTSWCDKQSIDYFDLSTNNPTSWQWYFQGAVPDTSTSQNPAGIYYPAFGTFDVQLIACNSGGCDTLLLTAFVTEFPVPPTPVITLSQDTLYSSPAFSYQWWNQNGAIAGATNSFLVTTGPGTYFVIISDSIGCSVSSAAIVITSIYESGEHEPFTLFPNPGSGEMTLRFTSDETGPAEICVYDVSGRSVKSFGERYFMPGNQELTLDISDIVHGIYLFEFKSHSQLWRTRMVVH